MKLIFQYAAILTALDTSVMCPYPYQSGHRKHHAVVVSFRTKYELSIKTLKDISCLLLFKMLREVLKLSSSEVDR